LAERERDPEPGPQRDPNADREREPVARDRPDVAADERPDHGHLGIGGVENVLAADGIALQDEADDRDEREQQREDGEERVVGDPRRVPRRAVLAELARHRDREPRPAAAALPVFEAAQQPPPAVRVR
jgi:hypothetical protein